MSSFTIDQLYEAYMDIEEYAEGGEYGPQDFGLDVWDWFGKDKHLGVSKEDWVRDWGHYLPTYDPTQVELAGRERDIDYKKALDVLDLSERATDRVYNTQTDIISTGLGEELGKATKMSGDIGLRSGSLESAIADTVATAGNKVQDLGDRLSIQKEEDLNKYNTTMVESALDFNRAEHENKKDFYNKTLAMINRLTEYGAFDKCQDPAAPYFCEDSGTCVEDANHCYIEQLPGRLDCALYPDDPDCEGYGPDDFDFDTLTFEMCQVDPSQEGCEGMYDQTDLNLTPDDYNTLTNYGEFNQDGSFTCHGNIAGVICTVIDEFLFGDEPGGLTFGEFTYQSLDMMLHAILGTGEDHCYWTGDFPCTDARCTEITDENGCRQCDCPDDLPAQPEGICLSTCDGSTPYQCIDCSCAETADDCGFPNPFD